MTVLDEARVAALVAGIAEGIPMAHFMGISLVSAGAEGIRLKVPLPPSRNHMGTAFAGALQAAATLTGWAMTSAMLLDEAAGDIVAQTAAIRFLKPLREDFETAVALPDARTADRFVAQYRRRGRARVRHHVELLQAGERHAVAEIRYAAVRYPTPD